MFGMNFGIELKMLGFMHIPEVCSHPQIFCTNFGIELKMLGFKIILEICFHPQMFGTNLGKELKILGFFTHPGNMFPAPKCLAQISGGNLKKNLHILEICFHPPNIWRKYQDRSENVGFYTHPRNMFQPPKYLAQISGQK